MFKRTKGFSGILRLLKFTFKINVKLLILPQNNQISKKNSPKFDQI